MALIAAFLVRTFSFLDLSKPPLVITAIDLAGIAIFGWCLYDLYIRKHRLTGLVTTGVFRYTRHPMYTGLLLMDLRFWFVNEYSHYFWLSATVLYVSVVVAAYFQEKETVARFGNETVDYYKKTPRLIFLYPVCH